MDKTDLKSMTHDELIKHATKLQNQLNSHKESRQEDSNKNEQQQRFLKETLEILPAIFYSKRLDGSFFMVNKAFQELFNLNEEQVIDKTNHELFSKEIADAFRKNDLEIIEHQKTIEAEEKAIGDDGKERFYHSFKFPYFNSKGDVWATGGISLDITEKKQFERQAFHNSKLASIGELASGVGHEINNPLSIIIGNLSLLKKRHNTEPHKSEATLKKINTCLNSAQRITNIVSGLRTFARDDADATHEFNILEMINESISMLEEIYNIEEVKILHQSELVAEDAFMTANRGRIQQLLINLITNAKDATKNQSHREIFIYSKTAKNLLEVSVKDNGCGIAPEIEQRIFDPFFTTKEVNEGTGIGLGLVANIAKDHGGSIDVKSKVGEGSIFRVSLPLSTN